MKEKSIKELSKKVKAISRKILTKDLDEYI